MATRTWNEFRDTYISGHESRVKAVINLDDDKPGDSAFIEVHLGDRTVILNPIAVQGENGDRYIDVDVHAFVGGEDASIGVFGMEDGYKREAFPAEGADTEKAEKVGHELAPQSKSEGWGAMKMVVLLVGRQTDGAR